MKAGITLILKKTDAVILPCGVAGAFKAWPHRRRRRSSPSAAVPGGQRRVDRHLVLRRTAAAGFYKGMHRDAILTDLRARITAAHEDAERIRRKPLTPGPRPAAG